MLRNHGSRLVNFPNFQQLYTAHFLPLFIHLILLILVFVYRDDLTSNCNNDYGSAPNAITWSDGWIGTSLGLVAIELILALTGFSIVRRYAIFFSIVLHSTGCLIISAYFMSDISICTGSPYLLFFCTFLPLVIELISWLELFAFNKNL